MGDSSSSLQHLGATVGVVSGLILVLLCLREEGGARRRGEDEAGQLVGGAVSHNQHLSVSALSTRP